MLDFNRQPAFLIFLAVVGVDSDRRATANDATERDPIRGNLEGSWYGVDWTLMEDHCALAQAATVIVRYRQGRE
ncbi:hypothetical protein OAL23_00585 [bacterium]|nr:hypothetical protein [bacterium]